LTVSYQPAEVVTVDSNRCDKNWPTTSVVTIASEPASIDYDRSFEKNRDVDVDVDSMLHGHVD